MNVISALVIDKILEYLKDKENFKAFYESLMEYISKDKSIADVEAAIEWLKDDPCEDTLDDLGQSLESNGVMEADFFVGLLLNQVTIEL